MDVVLEMFFFFLGNSDFWFDIKELTWRSYIIAEILSITSQVELIDKKKFAKVVLYKNSKILVVHIAAWETIDIAIYLSQVTQIAAL